MSISHIEWTDATWNPTTGCDRVSPGCDNCYALTMARRLKGMGNPKYQTDGDPRTSGPGFGLAVHPDSLYEPLTLRKPRRIFVNSMSDLFHAAVPRPFLVQVWDVMAQTPQHTYQILTKRPQRMNRVLRTPGPWSEPLPNVWLGTSVENQDRADERIRHLLATPAAVRFLSMEPLLGPVDLHARDTRVFGPRWLPPVAYGVNTPDRRAGDGSGVGGLYATMYGPNLDWVIIGGESGPRSRPMEVEWARSLVDQCQNAKVPVFVKQLGSVWARGMSVGGQSLAKVDPKGGDPRYWPEGLAVREYPASPWTEVQP